MSHLYDELGDRSPLQSTWAAIIATTPTDFSDRVSVVIPGIDDSLRWEECRWQARNDVDMPVRGNECLVHIDDNNEVWVSVWWPF